jgi:hypothetical protein
MALTFDDAFHRNVFDFGWRGDFGRLYDFSGAEADGRAVLYASPQTY